MTLNREKTRYISEKKRTNKYTENIPKDLYRENWGRLTNKTNKKRKQKHLLYGKSLLFYEIVCTAI